MLQNDGEGQRSGVSHCGAGRVAEVERAPLDLVHELAGIRRHRGNASGDAGSDTGVGMHPDASNAAAAARNSPQHPEHLPEPDLERAHRSRIPLGVEVHVVAAGRSADCPPPSHRSRRSSPC
jgi:hypothetical protein